MLNRPNIFATLALAALVVLVASPAVQGVQCVEAKGDFLQQDADCLCPAENVRTVTLLQSPRPAGTPLDLSADPCEQCFCVPIAIADFAAFVSDSGASGLKVSTAAVLHSRRFELQRPRLISGVVRERAMHCSVSDITSTPLRI